ncbi:MAG: MotA/TolQ/ExbB proton channel family protein [Anaeromyxobacter sp.]
MVEQLSRAMIASGAEWVLWALLALSLASVAVGVERLLVLRAGASADLPEVVRKLRAALRAGDLGGAGRLLRASPHPACTIAAAGLAEADGGPGAAGEAMAAAAGLERRRLERRLMFLGTVGNNAPFVGLLGTVIGVIGAFDALGRPQALAGAVAGAAGLAPERVMSTIAEALVATAVGLLVAIPAVALYNHLQTRVAAALADGDTLGHVVLAHLQAQAARPEPDGAEDLELEPRAADGAGRAAVLE